VEERKQNLGPDTSRGWFGEIIGGNVKPGDVGGTQSALKRKGVIESGLEVAKGGHVNQGKAEAGQPKKNANLSEKFCTRTS